MTKRKNCPFSGCSGGCSGCLKTSTPRAVDVRDAPSDEWIQGYAAALAAVQRTFDQSTVVKSVLLGYGLSIADLRHAGVEDFDLQPIKQAVNS